MIKIDTNKYKLEIEIDGVITPIRVYPLNTETSLVMSELSDTYNRLSRKINTLNKKKESIEKDNPDSPELDKISNDIFKCHREMLDVLNKFFSNSVVDYDKFKDIMKMIPAENSMDFLNEIFSAMQGNKKKETKSNLELIKSETTSDSEDQDSRKRK